MREIAYAVRGFLTVRKDSLRVPLSGSLTVHADQDSGLFTGDLVLYQSTISRTVLGASLFSATVQIEAASPVIGGVDHDGRLLATVTVDAVIAAVHAAGRTWISGGSCRTATAAIVPLRSKPGFDLEQGGRLVGRYHRPPFAGCGWITPLVNLLVAGPGNGAVIDLIPLTPKGDRLRLTPAPSGRRGGQRGGAPLCSGAARFMSRWGLAAISAAGYPAVSRAR
jgi:hypothetical protein